MKKIIKLSVIIVLLLTIFIIYNISKTDKLNYIALGDSLAEGMNPYGEIGYSYTDYLADYLKSNNKLSSYTKKYTKSGYITDNIINDISTNNELKKDLRESNLVTISIGANDFLKNVNFREMTVDNIKDIKSSINDVFPKIEKTIKEVRKYAKNKIIIVGYYNPIPFLFNTNSNDLDILFAYIDEEYQKIADSYNCQYLSLYLLFKSNTQYLPNPADIHPNLEGYKKIADLIFNFINNN